MDGEKFDDLIRQFCTTRLTRLSALRGLVAGAAAALTGATLASDDTDAKGKKRGNAQRGGGKKGKAQRSGGNKKGGKGRNNKKGGKAKNKKGAANNEGQQDTQAGVTAQARAACNPSQFPICHCEPVGGDEADKCQIFCTAGSSGHDDHPFDCACGAPLDTVVECPEGSCPDLTRDSPCCPICPLAQPDCCFAVDEKGNEFGFCTDLDSDVENCGACGNACTPNACQQDPVCSGGTCQFTAISCDDSNACTIDNCDPVTGCSHTDVDCDDDIFCTVDTCDATNGCSNTPDNSRCNDNVACTVDVCDPENDAADADGCTHTPDDSACDDDIFCTVDTCTATGCSNVPTNSRCDDGVACTVDVCDPENDAADADGCTHTPDDSACDDDIFCTVDTCTATGCSNVPTNSRCDDGDPCTEDTCDPANPDADANGCVHRNICPQNEGCTPGYWKTHQNLWPAGFSPSDPVSKFFSVNCGCNLGSTTLADALSLKGGSGVCGAIRTLLRAAVAALLNAAALDYPLSTDEVKAAVNTALATCDRAKILALATELDDANNSLDEFGNHNCPCNNVACPAS
jgi:hypothetical protein